MTSLREPVTVRLLPPEAPPSLPPQAFGPPALRPAGAPLPRPVLVPRDPAADRRERVATRPGGQSLPAQDTHFLRALDASLIAFVVAAAILLVVFGLF